MLEMDPFPREAGLEVGFPVLVKCLFPQQIRHLMSDNLLTGFPKRKEIGGVDRLIHILSVYKRHEIR